MSTRATGVAVLALGLAASASAVVPTFGALRVIIDHAYPLAAAVHTYAERRQAVGPVVLTPDHRKSAERGNDHAD